MDLNKASSAHTDWKVKLRMAIAKKERLDAASIGADNCCALGQWLHAEGRAVHGRSAVFSDLVKKHAAFHREAGAVAQAINAGQYDKASGMLEAGTPYVSASSAVVTAILGFKKTLHTA
ncbi:MAG: CZB domain-containing protein [Burkholderiaceae bacterium]